MIGKKSNNVSSKSIPSRLQSEITDSVEPMFLLRTHRSDTHLARRLTWDLVDMDNWRVNLSRRKLWQRKTFPFGTFAGSCLSPIVRITTCLVVFYSYGEGRNHPRRLSIVGESQVSSASRHIGCASLSAPEMAPGGVERSAACQRREESAEHESGCWLEKNDVAFINSIPASLANVKV